MYITKNATPGVVQNLANTLAEEQGYKSIWGFSEAPKFNPNRLYNLYMDEHGFLYVSPV